MSGIEALLRGACDGDKPSPDEAMTLAVCDDLAAMTAVAAEIRDRGHSDVISYSRKVFIPLTKLCRDSCHYCTFAHPPRRGERSYLTPEEVIAIAQAGATVGCREALFTLGDKPELRYRAAREELAALGHQTTISYLAAMSALVLQQTGLLPHLNPGVMSAREIADLRLVSVSQGLMLETAADRLSQRGGPHFGSPDKRPAVRLEMIKAAGEATVPFTSGILIGIGETRGERLQALLHLRNLHERHGHLQEIIIQNFRAKPGTRMAKPRGAQPRRSSLDHCRLPHPVRGGHEHPGAAQSLSGGAAASHCGGHQRLGRRLAGHAGSCEPGAALAGARSSRSAKPPSPARCWSSGSPFTLAMPGSRIAGSSRSCAASSCVRPMRKDSRASIAGAPARWRRLLPSPFCRRAAIRSHHCSIAPSPVAHSAKMTSCRCLRAGAMPFARYAPPPTLYESRFPAMP